MNNIAHALLELSSGTGGDWTSAIRHILQVSSCALSVDRASFWSLDERACGIRCDQGYVASSRLYESGATLFRSQAPTYFEALLGARIIEAVDARHDARTRELDGYLAARSIGAMLDIPVWLNGRLAGVLCHEHVGSTREWSESEVDYAMGAGPVVASALAARAKTDAEAMARRAAFLDDFSRSVFECLDAQKVAARAVRFLVPSLASCAAVDLVRSAGDVELLAMEARPELLAFANEARERLKSSRGAGLLAERSIREGQALVWPNVTPSVLAGNGIDRELSHKIVGASLRTGMVVPLTRGTETIGALTLLATDRHYSAADVSLAGEVAQRVASALENARLCRAAEDATVAREEFVILASHELRTPLASLKLAVDRKRRKGRRDDPNADAKLDEFVARQVERLTVLVQRMLDAMSLQSQGLSLVREPGDMTQIVDGVMAEAQHRAQRAGRPSIEYRRQMKPGEGQGRWDRARVGEAIEELLENASKFGEGRPIDVTLRSDAGDAVVSVHDRGDGIPPDRLKRLFSPFERACSERNFGGLGLGLFLAREVATAHGGRLDVESSPGKGTTFTMRLPRQS